MHRAQLAVENSDTGSRKLGLKNEKESSPKLGAGGSSPHGREWLPPATAVESRIHPSRPAPPRPAPPRPAQEELIRIRVERGRGAKGTNSWQFITPNPTFQLTSVSRRAAAVRFRGEEGCNLSPIRLGYRTPLTYIRWAGASNQSNTSSAQTQVQGRTIPTDNRCCLITRRQRWSLCRTQASRRCRCLCTISEPKPMTRRRNTAFPAKP
jgi:hypothetical protein